MNSHVASAEDAAAGHRSTLLIPFVLVCAVLADRARLNISTGGEGVLPLLAIVAPLAGIVTVARYGQRRSLRFLVNPAFVLAVLPYLALTALLPVLGIMFNGYPERTLLSTVETTTTVSFLVLGAALSSSDGRSWTPWLLLAMALQLIYAAGQAVSLSAGPGREIFAPFHAWDLSYLPTFAQTSRSNGLYLNPNELGFWAASTAILSWQLLRGRLRVLGLGLAVVTLVLSQSRGATVALLAALAVGAALTIGRGRLSISNVVKAAVLVTLLGIAVVSLALLLAPHTDILNRFVALGQVATEGPGADANFAARIDFWTAVGELNARYPWGTLGPVTVLLGTAVDSSWFAAFAQGSVPYVATLGMLLAASLLPRPSSRQGDALRLLAVVVAVAAISQTPLSYPPIIIFWVLLGASLSRSIRPGQIPTLAKPASAYRPTFMARPSRRPTSDDTGAAWVIAGIPSDSSSHFDEQ